MRVDARDQYYSRSKPGYTLIDTQLYNLALGTTCPCPTSPLALSLNSRRKILPDALRTCQHPSPLQRRRRHAPFRNLGHQNDTAAQLLVCGHPIREPCLYLQRERGGLVGCEWARGYDVRSVVRSSMGARREMGTYLGNSVASSSLTTPTTAESATSGC
jgi:hypothetical protein